MSVYAGTERRSVRIPKVGGYPCFSRRPTPSPIQDPGVVRYGVIFGSSPRLTTADFQRCTEVWEVKIQRE